MTKKKLGRRIAALRKKAGFTQKKLAEESDHSVEFVSLVERGINAPSVDGCARIVKVLKIPVRNLFDF